MSLRRTFHRHPFVKSDHEVVGNEIPEFPEEPENEFPGVGASLCKRYVRGELQIWVWLKLRGVVLDDGYYVVVFDRLSRKLCGGGLPPVLVPVGARHVDSGCRDYEIPVLVKDVQLVDLVNTTRVIGSVVRLYRLDNGECSWWNFPTNSEPVPLSWVREAFDNAFRGLPIADRELRAVIRKVPLSNHQLPCEVIQGAPKGMDDFSDFCPPVDPHRRRVNCLVDVRSSLVVNFGSEYVELRVDDTFELSFEGAQLDLRSLDFDSDTVERGVLPFPLGACTHAES